jgi:hypothetical protein
MKTRTATLGYLAVAAAMTLHARNAVPADVVVCFHDAGEVPNAVLIQAQSIVTDTFARAGLHLAWRACARATIQVRFSSVAQPGIAADALAYAHPFGGEGSAITVLYDRVAGLTIQGSAAISFILAYVLAHEIGHVLQAVDRHSDTGIMKAHWGGREYSAMSRRTLEFTPFDVDLMQRGLEGRPRR